MSSHPAPPSSRILSSLRLNLEGKINDSIHRTEDELFKMHGSYREEVEELLRSNIQTDGSREVFTDALDDVMMNPRIRRLVVMLRDEKEGSVCTSASIWRTCATLAAGGLLTIAAKSVWDYVGGAD